MERVKKGCTYFWIDSIDKLGIYADTDWRQELSTRRFEEGNYFHSTDEAHKVVAKLRAVLKGADVIEMPSEEEIRRGYAITMSDTLVNDSSLDLRTSAVVWDEAIKWLKSKIVK